MIQGETTPDWMDHGACVGKPTLIWFPDSTKPAAAALAISICHTCPVQRPCLDFAIEFGERGIWGGKSERARRRIAAGRRAITRPETAAS